MYFPQPYTIDLSIALVCILTLTLFSGTCYIAKKLMNKLKKKQKYLEITSRDIQNVSIAGLCHDLGHGPFSHVFDNHFLRTLK
jgi:HD superfamily phosphohydrolase